MKLAKVEIYNFRSIKEASIDFKQTCKILVGMNESGKSNILKSLYLLDSEVEISSKDTRLALPREDGVIHGRIIFDLELEAGDHENILAFIETACLKLDESTPVLQNKKDTFCIKDIVDSIKSFSITVDINNEERKASFNHEKLTGHTVAGMLLRPRIISRNKTFKIGSQDTAYSDYKIYDPVFSENIKENLEPAQVTDVISAVNEMLYAAYEEMCPEVIFWSYNDQSILPHSIDTAKFCENPDICEPLKLMFKLLKISDIPAEIEKNKEINNGMRNLLNRISEKATSHFRSVWKEYKQIEFELHPSGDNIEICIKDNFNRYEFSQRSDGFKRFASFLLSISSRIRSNDLQNAILLFDEPDTSLHPSGAKFLRDELIKISKSNLVVYSTHSMFMIDQSDIGKHLIVERDKEVTRVSIANESNIVEEEVIYNAIGFSTFEMLKKKNIIFEGYSDMVQFKLYIERFLPESHRKSALSIGRCFANGVSDCNRIVAVLDLADRDFIVVSDSDAPALLKKKEFEKTNKKGKWLTYAEIIKETTIVTLEDFLDDHYLISKFRLHVKQAIGFDLDTQWSIDVGRGFISSARALFAINKVDKQKSEEFLKEFKRLLWENDDTIKNLKASYGVMVEKVVKLLK